MRLKSANLREVKANNRVSSFLPKLFDGQPLEISQPIFEEGFQSGDEQRLAEAPRSGKENLVGVFRHQLVNQSCFVNIDGFTIPELREIGIA